MANVLRTAYTNFSSGELNPLLVTRTDASAYTSGAKTLRNWYLFDVLCVDQVLLIKLL